jgi:hypothetical protein
VVIAMQLLYAWLSRKEVFQALWLGGPLPPLAWLCLSSFVRFGHRVHLYSYDQLAPPSGVKAKPADSVLPREHVRFLHGSYATFANVFRYALLEKAGGWWVDTDVLCIGNPIPICDIAFAEEEKGTFNNALLKFPKRHQLVKELLAQAQKSDFDKIAFGDIGSKLLTTVINKHQVGILAQPKESFYPLHWLESYKVLFPEFTREIYDRISRQPFLHFWNYMYRFFGYDASKFRPLAGSFLDLEYSKWGIYEEFHLESPDERELRLSTKAYLTQDWASEHAVSHQLQVPCFLSR